MSTDALHVGIDFGTTNSALAWVNPDGGIELQRFPSLGSLVQTFRSILFFPAARYSRQKPMPKTGPQAIEAYLERSDKGRLIQSIKSLASDREFRRTQIGGHFFTFEELVAFILRDLTAPLRSRTQMDRAILVVGRPVRFVGATAEDGDDFAEERLRAAFAEAQLPNVRFEFEPIGAAFHYEQRLTHDEVVLIADFGGGTSDFSLVRVGPSFRGTTGASRILATFGLAFAGDAFDAAMIRNLVSPLMGRGSYYRSLDKRLPMPLWLYRNLERWHYLSFLQTRKNLELIQSLEAQAEEPEQMDRLLRLVEDDLGFQLHRAIQKTKEELSLHTEAMFRFDEPGLHVEEPVQRAAFEEWIAGPLDDIGAAVHSVLLAANLDSGEVDRVFLTGGTSLVPAVRAIFERTFGSERIRSGDEFTSVAAGLALRAKES